jgi:hypothetical protein
MSSLSKFELNQRASNFEQTAKKTLEQERRKAEKERILQQRARARREAHEVAVSELRKREAAEAEKVMNFCQSAGPVVARLVARTLCLLNECKSS